MAVVSQQVKDLGRVVGVCGVLAFFPSAASAEFDRGQALYENHCKSCHEDWVHTREGRRVISMSALRQRVAGGVSTPGWIGVMRKSTMSPII